MKRLKLVDSTALAICCLTLSSQYVFAEDLNKSCAGSKTKVTYELITREYNAVHGSWGPFAAHTGNEEITHIWNGNAWGPSPNPNPGVNAYIDANIPPDEEVEVWSAACDGDCHCPILDSSRQTNHTPWQIIGSHSGSGHVNFAFRFKVTTVVTRYMGQCIRPPDEVGPEGPPPPPNDP
jgi:hypothetical protein